MGNGPFNLVSWEFKQRLRLEKNPLYWDREHVPATAWRWCWSNPLGQFLHTKPVKWTGWRKCLPRSRLSYAKGRTDLRNFPGYRTTFLTVMVRPTFKNGQPNPLADMKVRQALATAIDRMPIATIVTRMGEQPATTYIPTNIFPESGVEPGFGFNPVAAKALFGHAGIMGGRLPGVTLLFRSNNPTSAATAGLANQWRTNLGIISRSRAWSLRSPSSASTTRTTRSQPPTGSGIIPILHLHRQVSIDQRKQRLGLGRPGIRCIA